MFARKKVGEKFVYASKQDKHPMEIKNVYEAFQISKPMSHCEDCPNTNCDVYKVVEFGLVTWYCKECLGVLQEIESGYLGQILTIKRSSLDFCKGCELEPLQSNFECLECGRWVEYMRLNNSLETPIQMDSYEFNAFNREEEDRLFKKYLKYQSFKRIKV